MQPFLICVYYGKGKPYDANLFIEDLVTDLISLENDKVSCLNRSVAVQFYGLVFDSPARAMIASVKSHNGYHSCHKCVIKGELIKNEIGLGERVAYPTTNSLLRTNNKFRANEYLNHCNDKARTILLILKFDIFKEIPLDNMHVTCLGVTKKRLKSWKDRYLSTQQLTEINA